MHIFNLKKDVKEYIYTKKLENKSIGFVPTMGALHKGHLSLIEKSKNENEITVVSIFVNPTQFDNPDDLEKYPNTIEKDTELIEKHGVDLVFLPTANEIYGDDIIAEKYDFGNLDKVMEGKHRIGHFDGVATIVKLLFDIVQPTNAYFGEKDFQQLQIIKKMVEIKKLSVNIVPCPIVREEDGLAMSSRNVRLSSEHRIKAPFIHQKMKEAAKLSKTKSVSEIYDYINECFANNNLLQLEYFEIRDEKTLSKVTDFQDDNDYMAFVAVFAQNIRLIDNIKLF
jgi:pantoate--beta-alanine ligase